MLKRLERAGRRDTTENAEKCAWTCGSNLLQIGNDRWKIQGNWSNNAYDQGCGYTDASAGFVQGCIDGTNNN